MRRVNFSHLWTCLLKMSKGRLIIFSFTIFWQSFWYGNAEGAWIWLILSLITIINFGGKAGKEMLWKHWKMTETGRNYRRVYSRKEEMSLVKIYIYTAFCIRAHPNLLVQGRENSSINLQLYFLDIPQGRVWDCLSGWKSREEILERK